MNQGGESAAGDDKEEGTTKGVSAFLLKTWNVRCFLLIVAVAVAVCTFG